MSAVWRASRAAVRRRRLQTVVIGLVVLASTTTIMLASGLLDAATAPFDRAFAKQNGAHAVVEFDSAKASKAQVEQTARRPGVEAAAGPFDQVVIDFLRTTDIPEAEGPLTVVGRVDPSGPVDRLRLLHGRWATAPGEVVINLRSAAGPPRPGTLGSQLRAPGVPPLTVVGLASSMSQSADAWVAPAQMAALRPSAVQMLYRFTDPSTEEGIRAGLEAVTGGLPAGSLTVAQSHLALRKAFSSMADAYLPLMALFGVLGLLVAVLIVANVVSGAVVSGYRHIGVLKAVGFTPNQVVAVYLTMVSVPAAAGCVLGTLFGNLLAEPVLRAAFQGIESGSAEIGISPWVSITCLLGMPLLVLLAALVPALRAHRLSAAQAISAGSAPCPGRGLRVQRALGGTRLPRAVSLGLGQPFARPGRTAMTMAAIVLGVTTVTLTTGLTSTMLAFGAANQGAPTEVGVRAGQPAFGQRAPALNDRQIEALLRSLPGARQVTPKVFVDVRLAGFTQRSAVNFQRGDTSAVASQIVQGRWPAGPGEIAAPPSFLRQRGLAVGDQITLQLNGRQTRATIVGQLMNGDARFLWSTWPTLTALDPGTAADHYEVQLADGSDAHSYANSVKAADPGLYPAVSSPGDLATTTVVGFASVFTTLLIIVAALGVFNTVLLNARERRRDLGMLKSIGMTPRQVTIMMVTSMAAPGAAGGLVGIPAGMLTHRVIVDTVGVVVFPEGMKDVWHAPQLAALALAGVTIAVLGALVPARSAARMTIAPLLHNE
ncbi:FtsX-like permease family protein [Nonomuraea sp. NEAU-A123]|uniref:FtsX-like permease family protein n=1 Tax=Nonomuraea sp. NEAU-A123 TaxID=2839649 RepID=UPI001BE4011E|nr:FtsX-like permease family protein [Nonomuraea sp. NEAU-A123]MBT2232982.1 ABC transporter permease [Nonomuraea sp. NEAU-A123]